MQELTVNMLIKAGTQVGVESFVARIVWMEQQQRFAYLMNLTNPTYPAPRLCKEIRDELATGQARVITDDSYARKWAPPPGKLTPTQERFFEENWPKIEAILNADDGTAVFSRRGRRGLFSWVGISHHVARRALFAYWCSGMIPTAIVPRADRRGGKGKARLATQDGTPIGQRSDTSAVYLLTPEDLSKMNEAYRELYLKRPGNTLREAYRQMRIKYFNCGRTELTDDEALLSQAPSYRQFRYHTHSKADPEKVANYRQGYRYTQANLAPRTGSINRIATAPGQYYFIDSTPLDITLVSSFDRTSAVGKPTLYLVQDVFSMMLVGFSLSLEPHSWVAQIAAIVNSLEDKVQICNWYGIHIEADKWPCHHAPQYLHGDRGELASDYAEQLVRYLGITVSNTPAYTPVMKGSVELAFRLMEEAIIAHLEGGGPRVRRPLKDTRGVPSLTLHELTQIIIHYIVWFNNSHILREYALDEEQIADAVEPVPVKLWEWGLKRRAGNLRTLSPGFAYLALLPRANGSLSRQGIRFKGLRYEYADEEMQPIMRREMFDAANRRVPLEIAYDPRWVEPIFVCRPDGTFVECTLLDRHNAYKGRGFAEVEHHMKLARRQMAQLRQRADWHNRNFAEKVQPIIEQAADEAGRQREAAGISPRGVELRLQESREEEQLIQRILNSVYFAWRAGERWAGSNQPPAAGSDQEMRSAEHNGSPFVSEILHLLDEEDSENYKE